VAARDPTVAGRYRILGRIASGGMGEVYRAHDDVLGREVAIKVLHPQYANDHGFIDRFRREARAAAVLNHPNIVGVYDWGVTEGTYFMVMEFVSGHNLRTVLSHAGRLEPAQVVDVASQVLSALDHAHGHGIVHRDVKPENILITDGGNVKVADFGLARAFADATISQVEGTVTGTVQYLAPEQVQGEPADPRTDLYATGIVMFELLTGQPPYSGETSVAIAYQHLNERVPSPSSRGPGVDGSLDAVVLHATEKDRDRRPASAREMRAELERAAPALDPAPGVAELARQIPAAEVRPVERAPTVTIPRAESRRRRRRRRVLRTLVALLVLLGVAAGGWATWTFAIPHYAFVPHGLTGLAPAQAEARLEAAGLRWTLGFGRNSLDVPAGMILLSQPGPGSKIRRGSVVTLIPSAGPAIVQVPDVGGKPSGVAQQTLRDAGFVPSVTMDYSDTVKTGTVISQDPAPNVRLQQGETVSIVVSKGPRPIVLDDYTGQQGKAVEATLADLGLTVKESQQYSVSVAVGDVIDTDPPASSTVHQGDTVTVVVSLGPRTFPMPNVVGKTKAVAIAELEGLGLKVRAVQLPGSTNDIVSGQSPVPGVTVQQGQQVTLYIGG
jgi:beta-lactam-binding protein with PASTA domain/predicted Ser/Thr protein kinase